MSYIVPDKIPSYCAECDWSICLYPNAYCKRVHKTSELLMAIKSRPDFCPLVEIKTPHGRLGDLDALYEEISNGNKAYNGIEGYDGEYPNIGNVDDCLDTIKYTEAVIEAEE